MKVFLNRTQLARRLGVAPETLRAKVAERAIVPDAMDGRGADLFSADAIDRYLGSHRALLKSGARMPKKGKPQ